MIIQAGHILGGTAFLFLPLGIFASKGLAPLFVLCALALLAEGWRHRRLAFRPGGLGWLFLAFTAYSMASGFWSLTQLGSVKSFASVALMLLGGFVIIRAATHLDEVGRKIAGWGLVAGGLLGFGILGLELASDGYLIRHAFALAGKPITNNLSAEVALRPGYSLAALILWPWSLRLYRSLSQTSALPLIGAALAIVILGGAKAAIAALIFGFGFALAALFMKRGAAIAFSLIVLGGFALMPLIPGQLPDPLVSGKNFPDLPNSAVHRISIWQTTAKHIAERPILGHGFDTSRALYGPATKIRKYFFPDIPERKWFNDAEPIPLHPHNLALQIWLELGFVGALLFAVFLLWVIRAIQNQTGEALERAALFGFFAAALLVAGISYGAWQTWWLTALLMLSGIGIQSRSKSPVPAS